MKKRVIAMIPARMGSQRVKRKNLRLINGKPLIWYVTDACKKAGCFDEIYINSESETVGRFAKEEGVKFYKRPEQFSSNTATNDEFGLDFMEHTPGDILIQILPTSPLLTVEEIQNFTEAMIEGEYDTLVSVKHEQIGCVYDGKPLNFERTKRNPPSQEMKPILVYATALMGWRYESFKDHMRRFGCAYHGADGKIGYFELRGLSTIDIDREEDFALADSILRSQSQGQTKPAEYYGEEPALPSNEHAEVDVPSILKKDGVMVNDLYDCNHEVVNVTEIFSSFDHSKSWSKRLIDTDSNSMTLISQLPGEGNRPHYHPNWNEWWYIVDGEWIWDIEGQKKIIKKGDVVLVKKGRKHKITATGNKPAVRMAVSRADVPHVYTEDGTTGSAAKGDS